MQKHLLHNAAVAAADGEVITVSKPMVAVQIAGTFVATVTFKESLDGSNFVAVEAQDKADGTQATTATAAGIYLVPVTPGARFMADITAYTSGSVTVVAIEYFGLTPM